MVISKTGSCKTLSKFLFVFIFAITPLLYAQDDDSHRVERTNHGFQFFQTINFPAVPDVSKYEVEIQRNETGEWTHVETVSTPENKIEVSLRYGSYRYQITAYNRMNLPVGQSLWQNFEILPAYEPEVETFQPFYALYFELAETVRTLTITGNNFSADSEFALVRKSSFDWTEIPLEGSRNAIIPVHVEARQNHAVLSFTRDQLRQGNYQIFIRNPGGIWTRSGEVRVGFKNSNDFTISYGFSPMLALFDTSNTQREGIHQLERFNPEGSIIRFSWVPIKTKIGNFGLEAELNFLVDKYLQSRRGEISSGEIFSGSLDYGTVNILYQLPVGERLQHNIRFGIMPDGESYHDGHAGGNIQPLYFNLGYSTQYFLWKNIFVEMGLNFQYVISLTEGYDLNNFIVRPFLGIGLQLGRWMEYAEVAEGAKRGEDYSLPVTRTPKGEHLLSFGWSPMIPLFGIDRYASYDDSTSGDTLQGNQYLRSVNALGLSLRYAYLPYRWGGNKIGFEVELSILGHMNQDKLIKLDNAAGTLDLISEFLLGVRYQRILNDDWLLNLTAAFGYMNSYEYFEYYSGGISGTGPSQLDSWGYSPFFDLGFKFGLSAQYFFWKDMYAEAGLDMSFMSASENIGILRLFIGVGWQFNRGAETGLRLPGTGLPPFITENKHEFIVSANWIPLIPLNGEDGLYAHDEDSGEKINAKILDYFNAGGVGIYAAWLPFSWDKNKLGFDFEYNILNYPGIAINGEENTSNSELLSSETIIGVRYQRILTDDFYLNARLGFGFANSYYLQDFQGGSGNVYRPSHNNNFGIKAGVSVQYFIWQNLFAEAGLNLTSVISGKGSPFFFLRPNIGIGWQFKRN